MGRPINLNRQLKLGAIFSYLAITINIVSALIYSPWMLRQIGSGDYGLYALSCSLINIFMLDLGIGAAVSRFVSKYLAEDSQDKVNNLLGVIYKLFLGIASLISIILIIVYFYIDDIYLSLTSEELNKFKIVYLIVATFTVLSFPLSATLNGLMTSYEKFIEMKLCDLIHKIVVVILIVFVLLFGYGLYALVTINAIGNLLFLLVKFVIIKKTTPVSANFSYFEFSLIKEIFGFSIWVLVNTIMARLIINFTPSILGISAGTIQITLFSFAAALEGYTYTFASAIDGLFIPKVARLAYRDKDISKIEDLMIKVGRFQLNVIGLIFVGFVVIGKEFITLWLGANYIDVYYGAVLLIFPALFYLSQQIGKETMVMTNKVKYLTYVNIGKALISVGLVFMLSRNWGVVGACVGISVAYMFRSIVNLFQYKYQLNIAISGFIRNCYFKMMLPQVITLVICIFISMVYVSTGWLHLVIKGILVFVVYVTILWSLAYNREEKALFVGIIHKLIKR